MSFITKYTYACPYCGSPYIEYHKFVRSLGLTLSGEIATEEDYVEDSDYCNVCGDNIRPLDAKLIYTPDHQLIELAEDYIDRVLRIYSIPHDLYNETVYFLDKPPTLLAELALNDFTHSIVDAIANYSLPEQHKLELLNTLIGQNACKTYI